MSDRAEQPANAAVPAADADAVEPDRQLAFLEELVEEHATVAGDVIEIDSHTWAIHGEIAVDGDVLMAEYESEEHARIVLAELAVEEERLSHPEQ
jgi:hypothetical protein